MQHKVLEERKKKWPLMENTKDDAIKECNLACTG